MEATGKGSPTTWPRDRNCKIPVPPLEHVFKQMLEVNKSVKAYRKKVRRAGRAGRCARRRWGGAASGLLGCPGTWAAAGVCSGTAQLMLMLMLMLLAPPWVLSQLVAAAGGQPAVLFQRHAAATEPHGLSQPLVATRQYARHSRAPF
jgi:hypothetical protein